MMKLNDSEMMKTIDDKFQALLSDFVKNVHKSKTLGLTTDESTNQVTNKSDDEYVDFYKPNMNNLMTLIDDYEESRPDFTLEEPYGGKEKRNSKNLKEPRSENEKEDRLKKKSERSENNTSDEEQSYKEDQSDNLKQNSDSEGSSERIDKINHIASSKESAPVQSIYETEKDKNSSYCVGQMVKKLEEELTIKEDVAEQIKLYNEERRQSMKIVEDINHNDQEHSDNSMTTLFSTVTKYRKKKKSKKAKLNSFSSEKLPSSATSKISKHQRELIHKLSTTTTNISRKKKKQKKKLADRPISINWINFNRENAGKSNKMQRTGKLTQIDNKAMKKPSMKIHYLINGDTNTETTHIGEIPLGISAYPTIVGTNPVDKKWSTEMSNTNRLIKKIEIVTLKKTDKKSESTFQNEISMPRKMESISSKNPEISLRNASTSLQLRKNISVLTEKTEKPREFHNVFKSKSEYLNYQTNSLVKSGLTNQKSAPEIKIDYVKNLDNFFNTIPFIVGKSINKTYHLGLSFQQTMSMMKRMSNPKEIVVTPLGSLDVHSEEGSQNEEHKCPALEAAWVEEASDWENPWDLERAKQRARCTCLPDPRHSTSLRKVLKQLAVRARKISTSNTEKDVNEDISKTSLLKSDLKKKQAQSRTELLRNIQSIQFYLTSVINAQKSLKKDRKMLET